MGTYNMYQILNLDPISLAMNSSMEAMVDLAWRRQSLLHATSSSVSATFTSPDFCLADHRRRTGLNSTIFRFQVRHDRRYRAKVYAGWERIACDEGWKYDGSDISHSSIVSCNPRISGRVGSGREMRRW